MNLKKIFLIILIVFLFISCGKEDSEIVTNNFNGTGTGGLGDTSGGGGL